MRRLVKGVFGCAGIVGVGIIGLSVWAAQEIKAYEALTPAQRAEVDLKAQAEAESERRERLRGTDCEKLDALSCYETRRQRQNLEAAAKAWEKSDLKKAYEDAGVR